MRAFCIVLALLLVASVAVASEKDKPFVQPVPGGFRALDCTNAIPLTCGVTYSGTNIGAPNNVSAYSCIGWTENGGEVVYELVIPAGLCLEVTGTISNLTADLDIFFLGSCDENDCLAYGNTTFTTSCLEAGTYYVVVDGYGTASSDFTLLVDCVECDCPVPPCCPFEHACYFLDFNEDPNNFLLFPCGGAPLWSWGPAPEIPQIACDGVPVTNVLGTALGGNYPSSSGEIAAVGPFFIDQYCTCLELCHFYDTENRYDGGNVKVSVDGGVTWTLITPARGYDAAEYTYQPCIPGENAFTGHQFNTAFLRDCFDISEFVGMDIMVGFFFGSDSSVNYPGWYIKWLKIGSDDSSPVEDSSWGNIKALYR